MNMKRFYGTIALIFLTLGMSFSQITFTIPPVCEGGELLLIIDNPVTGAIYHFTMPSGSTFPASTTDTPRVSPAMMIHNGQFSLDVELPGGSHVSGGTATATVYPKPDLTITVSPLVVCAGSQVTLTATDKSQGGSATTYVWNLGGTPGTGATVQLVPNNNVTCYVTATSSHNCITQTSKDINISGGGQVRFSNDPACESTPLTILPFDSSATYIWSTGETTSVVYPVITTTPTTYTVTYTGSNGCSYVLSTPVNPKPTANFIMDKDIAIIEDVFARVNFTDISTDAISWQWNFGDNYSDENVSHDPSPYHDFTEHGKYQVSLTVRAPNGCTDMMTKVIAVETPFRFFIPNAFSPNGDGVNKEFCVKGDGFILENFSMRIYDKYSNLLYKSEYIYDCWDGRYKGKFCPQGIYVAIIQVTTATLEVKEYVVPVTIVR